ncbi:MAG: hypothetical protein AB1547_14995 [Thermodesulfobacteriota bacterium]
MPLRTNNQMREVPVHIPVATEQPSFQLEARMGSSSGSTSDDPAGVAICHPHPLYGGDMDNSVVRALRDVFAELGMTTLRFNFRGVGGSSGRYGAGVGEVADLCGAFSFLKTEGVCRFYGAGYSFGSWVLLQAIMGQADGRCLDVPLLGLVLVSPPLEVMDFKNLRLPQGIPTLILVGSEDCFCSIRSLQTWLGAGTPTDRSVVTIAGADHFYGHRLGELQHHVRSVVAGWL